MRERLVKPIRVLLQQYDLAHLASCHRGRSIDANVRVESVLVEENRAARKVGQVKSFLKNVMFDILTSILQINDMPLYHNLFLDGIFLSTSRPRVPVVNAELFWICD